MTRQKGYVIIQTAVGTAVELNFYILEDMNMDNNALTNAIAGLFGGVSLIVWLVLLVLYIVANFRIYSKAGEAGWKCIIPIYSTYILFKIIYGNGWKFLFLLIPIFGEIVAIVSLFRLAKVFGKGVGFGLGLWFLSPIFILILAFGSAQYEGPVDSFI